MIAEIGHVFLWIAAALALFQIYTGVVELRGGPLSPARPLAIAQGTLTGLAFLLLIWLFIVTDLSVDLVVRNSHSLKPMLYKISGAWGNHEGSMLLWLSVLGAAGAAVALFEQRLKPRTLTATLVAQSALSLGFFAFLLFVSNPFKRLPAPATEGMGLNPLLQDPGLAFHPPTLYFGYVGLSVAFSFAVGALITRDVGPAFARAMRPWVLASWIFLTLGITAGSYWAYYELGWGGWWFWDPVENASLMPWLAATALLHSVSVTANRDALRAWTVMLAVVAFSMSMIGTFIVRSGLLTSVHAFAVDPERGSFILALLALYIGGALALFGARIGAVAEGKRFALLSREGSLVINNLLLSVILVVVLTGTLAPIVAEAMGSKISVGPPYFNPVSAIFALPLFAVMVIGPLLRWRRDDGVKVRRWAPVMLVVTMLGIGLLVWLAPGMRLLPLLGLALAAAIAIVSLVPLAGRNLLRTPLPIWGMVIAHFGVAMALAGMATETAFIKERLVAASPGDRVEVGDWQVTFNEIRPVAGPNWTAVEAVLTARRGGSSDIMRPQARYFSQPSTETNEAALLTTWNGQLYAVLGHRIDGTDGAKPRWQLRLWWKPLVWWIWAGGGLIALGGLLALIGRMQPVRMVKVWFARLQSRSIPNGRYGR
ncbi:heme lyase CcmF/NrfE family subunit [Sphingomonas lacunae]|uniref:Heme lyase CcmF/NrfE family subunit n=1 Tax=Sphingomonas lacunae TaxID=2698828 RepID=A0A6M4AVQ2_9SPHN|nr:heme lyase CcmF/NrfE family subunit [Sphingomonas lacunae]QJQ33203.1 heme lyase CcmF/NrfE family subunit [Sphingomonas lacunae]